MHRETLAETKAAFEIDAQEVVRRCSERCQLPQMPQPYDFN
jgi:hypothetical protein